MKNKLFLPLIFFALTFGLTRTMMGMDQRLVVQRTSTAAEAKLAQLREQEVDTERAKIKKEEALEEAISNHESLKQLLKHKNTRVVQLKTELAALTHNGAPAKRKNLTQRIERLETSIDDIEDKLLEDPTEKIRAGVKKLEAQITKIQGEAKDKTEEAAFEGTVRETQFVVAAATTAATGAPLNPHIFSGSGGWKGFVMVLFASAIIGPMVALVANAIKNTFETKLSLFFKNLFGGINNQIEKTALHCQSIFNGVTQLHVVLKTCSPAGPNEGVSARDKALLEAAGDDAAELELATAAEEQAKQGAKCVLCQKTGGNMEQIFECPLKKHFTHSRCLQARINKNPRLGLNCSVCKATRKLRFILPDLRMGSMVDRLGFNSQASSIVISAKVSQRRIDSLLKRLRDNDGDNAKISFGELVAIRENLRQICNVLTKKDSFEYLTKEDTKNRLAVIARMGELSCGRLTEHVRGALRPNDVRPARPMGGAGHFGGGMPYDGGFY